LILLSQTYAFADPEAAFNSEVEVDVHYKKQVPIYLQHDLGDVSIQGWNQDLIRVRLKKTVTADSETNANLIFKKFELVSLETPNAVELRVGTPQGTDLLTKLRNRQQKKNIKVDLEIKAPASLVLSILMGAEKKLILNQWRNKISITGKKNTLDLSKLRSSSPLNINCPDCSLTVSDSEFSGSILMSDQKIEMKKTKATPKPILIFTQKGEVSLEGTEGDIQIRTNSGDVFSKAHQGSIQVQSETGKVNLVDLDGDADVQSKLGEIKLTANRIQNQLELKNTTGDIDITLPHEFKGEVNLQSIKGDVFSDFNIQKDKKKMEMLYGPELKGRIFGKIGDQNTLSVTAFSENGKISLKQKELSR